MANKANLMSQAGEKKTVRVRPWRSHLEIFPSGIQPKMEALYQRIIYAARRLIIGTSDVAMIKDVPFAFALGIFTSRPAGWPELFMLKVLIFRAR